MVEGKWVIYTINDKEGNVRYVGYFSGTRVKGEGVGTSKVTEDVVRSIRSGFKSGKTKASLTREYGISYTQVSRIINMEAWKHVK